MSVTSLIVDEYLFCIFMRVEGLGFQYSPTNEWEFEMCELETVCVCSTQKTDRQTDR